ncbi:MAG: response regulator transcription factor [Clostridiaceae bacterium]|nr:response regulator transcription factor [Clostridiaceae bacterium]
MINVAIVDDQQIIGEGLKRILESYEDIQVVALGEDGREALDIVKKHDVDVILMDIRMPNCNGVEGVKLVRQENKEVKILMLTTFDDEEYIIKAMAYKANGYLFKDIPYDKLVASIRDAYNGGYIMEPKVAQVLAENISFDKGEKYYKDINLTSREIEVIKLIKDGFSNKQIANALFISEGTVKNYVSNIYEKAGVENRVNLINKLNNM